MNISNDLELKARLPETLEVGVYAALSAGLMGRLLFLDSAVTRMDALLALAGEVFGFMAVCALAPVAALLRGGKAPDPFGGIRRILPVGAKPASSAGALGDASNDRAGGEDRRAA